MKTALSALALCTALGLSAVASAQVPSGGGGSDAKGNAPLKQAHTVNDGGARRGHNSFTEGQARTHILKAGYQSVTGLAKGDDGVWRGTAMKNGVSTPVGMDFKGNVSEGVPPGSQAAMMTSTTSSSSTMSPADASKTAMTSTDTSKTAMASSPAMHHRHHRMHHMSRCAHPGANGTACSGVDRNQNGVSDKEDRAMKAGAHP